MLYSWCTLVYPGIPWYTLTVYSTLDILTLNPVYSWAQNLRQGIVMKTSFGTRASRMGLGSFVDINIFVLKYYFIWFLPILHFFKSLKSKFTQLLRPQKGNSGVSFNDTLLNFGLCLHNTQYTLYIQNQGQHSNQRRISRGGSLSAKQANTPFHQDSFFIRDPTPCQNNRKGN